MPWKGKLCQPTAMLYQRSDRLLDLAFKARVVQHFAFHGGNAVYNGGVILFVEYFGNRGLRKVCGFADQVHRRMPRGGYIGIALAALHFVLCYPVALFGIFENTVDSGFLAFCICKEIRKQEP